MAVTLPTAADVRKVREQAAKNAAERAGVARTPLFAVLGAGDAAVTAVSKAVADARALPQKLTVAELREQAEAAYAGFAERGEKAWGKLRTRPQVKQAIARLESYTEVLDARVDGFVDDAHDAAEKALAVVTRQTRSTGEKVALSTQKAADEAAEKLTEVSGDAAERLTEAGDEVAHETRSVTRRIANQTAPKASPKLTQPKLATRRTTNGTSGS
jgi:heparin binding hemagglutinin HbhA